ncbi:MAG TPA: hypothetical protein VLB68_21530 [Pyrinomonadaceae bacterium]|nr:hypothetical protein [Pyrinomonadaceae bacterium]
MADPVARKRLKKKMIDRWENEGGRIATDTTDPTRPTTEDKAHGKKLSSSSEKSTVGTPPSPTKGRKPTRK